MKREQKSTGMFLFSIDFDAIEQLRYRQDINYYDRFLP
jgi:hypothetical protein